MCSWAAFSFFSEAPSASSSAAICRRSALICWLRFSIWAMARAVAAFCRSICVLSALTWPGPGAGVLAFGGAAQAVAFALGRRQRGVQLRDLLLETDLAGPLQREQVGKPRDLRVEARQRGVLAGDFLRQKELRHHEHGEQKDDRQDQRRQGVDEARPVIHAAVAAAAGKRHSCAYLL